MKRVFAFFVVATLCLQALFLASCNATVKTAEFDMKNLNVATYDNKDFSDWSQNGQTSDSKLQDQWENYGVGDPYVLRFNGTYYLYCSTRDDRVGIRAWKSVDLVNWTKCNPDGKGDLPAGYVSNESVTGAAYAPEVYYFNGEFFMYTSPAGRGHRILRATSPEGPFTDVSGNIGMNIDGSVFIDDDEKMYFLNANSSGITIRTMKSMSEIDVADVSYRSANLANASIGDWTEGPMLIKRDGIYYLTYTGPNVLSQGYRVSYSTEMDGNPIVSRNAFTKGADSPLLLNVDETNNFKGLGHSATVLGPDLDGYYIAYHTLKALTTNGPYRSFALDRLLFNGTHMSVDGSLLGSVAPRLPTFYAQNGSDESMRSDNGFLLSAASTDEEYSVEFNFVGSGVKNVFGYANADDYFYVSAEYDAHKIVLAQRKNGVDTVLSQGTLSHDFDASALHTIRVACSENKINVYFDNMRKIADYQGTAPSGKVGYQGAAEEEVFATVFSDVANGSSDKIELKKVGAEIGAATYLDDEYFEGVQPSRLGAKSGLEYVDGLQDTDEEAYQGAGEMTLGAKGDFARYAVYYSKDGHYGLKLTYQAKYAGKKIGVQFGGGAATVVTLPKVDAEAEVLTAMICETDAKAGAGFVSLYCVGDEAAFISLSMEEKSYGQFEFENDLSDVVEKGADYLTMYRMYANGHATRGGSIMLVYFGDQTLADYEVEVDVRFLADGVYSAGLLLRGKNFANASTDGINSIQGYYVSLNTRNVSFSKFNYGDSSTNLIAERHDVAQADLLTHTFHVKAVVKGNLLEVWLDGQKVVSYVDAHPFFTGHVGLYGDGAEVVYTNLKIKGI